MKLTIFITIFCIVASYTCDSFAQDAQKKTMRKYTVGLYPLSTIDGGLTVDFEKRMKDTRNWGKVKLSGYYAPTIEDNSNFEYWSFLSGNEDYRGLKGGGLEIGYKSFFHKEIFYWAGGLHYNYYNVTYRHHGYEPFVADDMTYYQYLISYKDQQFNKIGASLYLGVQTPLNARFICDGYLSLGYVRSFYDKNKAAFDSTILSFGHSGFTIWTGIRVGLSFGKVK